MGTKFASARIWLSHVEVVTFDGLQSFIDRYLVTEDAMAQLFPKEGMASAYRQAFATKA